MQERMGYKDEMQNQSAQVSGQVRGVCRASGLEVVGWHPRRLLTRLGCLHPLRVSVAVHAAYFPDMRSSRVLSQITKRCHVPFAARLLVTLGVEEKAAAFSGSTVATIFGSELECASRWSEYWRPPTEGRPAIEGRGVFS